MWARQRTPAPLARGAATLGRGRDVCSHAIEGGGLVGIGPCFTGAIRFTALHLSATFDERPFVGPGLECSVRCDDRVNELCGFNANHEVVQFPSCRQTGSILLRK